MCFGRMANGQLEGGAPMPRTTGNTSALEQIQKRVQRLLADLGAEIRSKQAELRRLKEEESQLSNWIGLRTPHATRRSNGAASARADRIDWGRVLQQLSKQFKATNIRKIREVENKRASEVYAAIARWIDAGAVKRKDRGQYERVK
jgi:hypothetical protein